MQHLPLSKLMKMNNLHIQVALDFVECTTEQKAKFTNHLESINWQSINPNKLWNVACHNQNDHLEIIHKIERELLIAKEISNLYELDYAIISPEDIYFNQLN